MKSRRPITNLSVGLISALGIVLALSNVDCGGGGVEPAQPDQPPPGSQPQQGGQAQQQQQGGGQSTEALIGELLTGIEGGGGNQTPTQPQPAPAPTETIQPAPSPHQTGSRLDTFQEDTARIRQTVPGWDNGTGLTIKFLKESTGKRLSLIYVDPTPPAYKNGPGLWMIQAKATASGKTLGHVVLLLKTLAPGRYQGSPQSKDMILAVCMGEQWNGKDPDTTWSVNPGSWSEITLRPGRSPGDLEGDFRGKLVDNKGTGFHTIEAGYIYINR